MTSAGSVALACADLRSSSDMMRRARAGFRFILNSGFVVAGHQRPRGSAQALRIFRFLFVIKRQRHPLFRQIEQRQLVVRIARRARASRSSMALQR